MSNQLTDKNSVVEQTRASVPEMAPFSVSPSDRLLRRIATLLFLLVAGILTLFGYYASSICITVVLAAFLAILFDPLVVRLEKFYKAMLELRGKRQIFALRCGCELSAHPCQLSRGDQCKEVLTTVERSCGGVLLCASYRVSMPLPEQNCIEHSERFHFIFSRIHSWVLFL